MARDLPIDARIVEQLAKATIKNLIDGIVELVTNSDDSYKRIEERGKNTSGQIEIHVNRQKGGICQRLMVRDFAEGMTREELERAIIFAGETRPGKSIRGLFGRGLKETIIALGEGQIETVKDGKLTRTRLWFDEKLRKPQYDDELLSGSLETELPNGTMVTIDITNQRIKIPEYEKFKEQLSTHFALRDINSSPRRKVTLFFEDLKRQAKRTVPIKFSYPGGTKVLEEERNLAVFGDRVAITVYESDQPLETPRNNPFGLAGILIKTEGAILDNQLFRFDTDPAGLYFYGQAICKGLEKRLRNGETGIIDPNRSGLEWRHEYCQALANVIEQVLDPLVLAKRRNLTISPTRQVKESTKKMLTRLCSLLNQLAKQELDELPEFPTLEADPNITRLLIKPEVANIEKDKPRTLSVYAPIEMVVSEGKEVLIRSDNPDIRPLSSAVNLDKHPRYPGKLWYRYFKVVGVNEQAEGVITARLGKETAFAKVKVAPLSKKRRGTITGRKGGFISEIVPDELDNPSQRVAYREGIIKVYIKSPSVSKFLRSGLDGIESGEGRLLLAELVGEAFCRELARQGLEFGKYVTVPGSEIDSFNAAINELQKKYLHKIQQIIFAWKF